MSKFRYQHLIGKLDELKKTLLKAEIGVNISEGDEALYLKNENGNVIEFSPKDKVEKSITEQVDEVAKKLKEYIDSRDKEIWDNAVFWHNSDNGNRKHIVLENHDSILGATTEGMYANLAMLSKWNVADFGSKAVHANLNGKNERPTYNDENEIALTKDVPTIEVEESTMVVNTFM